MAPKKSRAAKPTAPRTRNNGRARTPVAATTQPVLVTGSIGIDTIITPDARADKVLGGSATYFAAASAKFTRTALVSVAGGDLHPQAVDFYHGHKNIDACDLTIVKHGKTFAWEGQYLDDFKERVTLRTDLNVVIGYEPTVSHHNRSIPFVFLANTEPVWQGKVLDQMHGPRFVGVDTMNLWINNHRPHLDKLLKKADLLMVNDSEAKELTGEKSLLKAAQAILRMGPKAVIIKKGPFGSSLYTKQGVFHLPAHEIPTVVDPTGAGDSFAGGLMGYLAATGRTDLPAIRAGMLVGAVCAALAVSDFSVHALLKADRAQILKHARNLRHATICEDLRL
ncbi:MAG TPA: PfkB family carbohydrate kinase [Planctomycetota bacterium]|nr:PfkB family carbohydrate kinase [Planctomycetota bacterium]